ncbi:hypothetical protein DsansV1_C06g0061261 [Dioscorea sansibarensis]
MDSYHAIMTVHQALYKICPSAFFARACRRSGYGGPRSLVAMAKQEMEIPFPRFRVLKRSWESIVASSDHQLASNAPPPL